MLDRITEYLACLTEPQRWAIATVVEVSGSVPRPVGTSMAVRDDATCIGSVSGGCVEAAVVHAALACIATGVATVQSYGYGDDDAFAIGLLCGGDVRVLVQPFTQVAAAVTALSGPGPVAVVRVLPGGSADLAPVVVADPGGPLPAALARALGPQAGVVTDRLRHGGSGLVEITDRDTPGCPVRARLLVETRRPRARLLVYGANDFSAALARLGAQLDRHVVVCDARPVFATAARHPGADEVLVARPVEHLRVELAAGRVDERTAVVVLTHDPRFDLPVLDLALRSAAGYVGAMGSRQTAARRAQELVNGGLPRHLLDRLHAPIGLDIGARTPAEVAVAILAELVADRRGHDHRHGVPELRHTTGPVHAARRTPEVASWT